MKPTRIFGILFLLAFVAYGAGNGLAASALGSPHSLAYVHAHKTQLILGAVLMGLIHSFLILALSAIMASLLGRHGKIAAYGYLGAAIVSSTLLAVGAIFLMLLAPLSDDLLKAGTLDANGRQVLSELFQKGNFFAYQIGMGVWGFGGLMLCHLLYASNALPRFIPVWGFIGYLVFISGAALELLGHKAGMIASVPGGLFEILLGTWLIVRGFRPSAPALDPQGLA
jgi:hypothetical protein